MITSLKTIGAGATLAALLSGPAQADPITLTDLAGRTVELEAPAERVVTLPVPMGAMLIALARGAERLVGLHPESKIGIDDEILGTFFPEAKEISSAVLAHGATRGFTPDVEAIKALKPDLVVQWAFAGDENIDPLVEAGFNTVLITRGANDDYIRETLSLLGAAIDEPDRAQMLIDWRDEVSAELARGLEGVPDSERPKVAYFFYSVDELWTEGGDTYGNWQLNLVGGRNAAADIKGWGKVSAEQVLEWNPDVIFISTFEPETHVDKIYEHEILGGTTAAKSKRVYQVPIGGYRWDPGSAESPLGWMWYAEVLHPDRFDFDVRAEIKEWYPKLYGHTPTEEQIDKILQMDMNAGSAGYDRFAAH
jgi:iron complex transport system substrate-binding protein